MTVAFPVEDPVQFASDMDVTVYVPPTPVVITYGEVVILLKEVDVVPSKYVKDQGELPVKAIFTVVVVLEQMVPPPLTVAVAGQLQF